MAKPKIPPMVSPALKRGDVVYALRDLPAANVSKGSRGVVFEEANAYGDGFGPMVRWGHNTMCNVYAGDVVGQKEYDRLYKLNEARREVQYATEDLAILESAPKRIPAARKRWRRALSELAKLSR
jgi:hypothetical protein